jgi:hypothetical protein
MQIERQRVNPISNPSRKPMPLSKLARLQKRAGNANVLNLPVSPFELHDEKNNSYSRLISGRLAQITYMKSRVYRYYISSIEGARQTHLIKEPGHTVILMQDFAAVAAIL